MIVEELESAIIENKEKVWEYESSVYNNNREQKKGMGI